MHVKSITLKIYERILTEAKKNDTAEKLKPTSSKKKKLDKPKEEAPDDAILGNYAFANSREGVPPEVNTKVEDKLEKELTTHFVNNTHMSGKSGEALKTSLENDWYEKILAEPTQTNVYRGLRVYEEWMIENIGEDWREQFRTIPYATVKGRKAKGQQLKINMVLHPENASALSAVTSWTTNIGQAYDFANFNSLREHLGVICCAAIKDNPNQFIDASKGLYDIPEFGKWPEEKEILGIGSITISHIILL